MNLKITKWICPIIAVIAVITAMCLLPTNVHAAPTASKYYLGVDVSQWQGNISQAGWNKAKAAKYDFAIIRVAYAGQANGSLHPDESSSTYYKNNITRASKAGMKVGAYIYSEATTKAEAEAEAAYVIKLLKPYKDKITMPVVMDLEDGNSSNKFGKAWKAGKLSKKKVAQNYKAFADKIAAAGYTPMFYSYTSWVKSYMDMNLLKSYGYPFWLAEYNSPKPSLFNKYFPNSPYEFWQYSSSASVSGLPGKIDVNRWYTTDLNTYTPYTEKAIISSVTVNDKNQVTVKWNKTKNATKYRVDRKKDGDSSYTTLTKTCAATSYTDSNTAENTKYIYRVLPYRNSKSGKWSDTANITTKKLEETYDKTVSNVKATLNQDNSTFVSWNAESTADEYVLQKREGSAAYAEIARITDTSYKDTAVENGKKYSYRVAPVKGNKVGKWSANADIQVGEPSQEEPKPETYTEIVSGVTITPAKTGYTAKWTKAANATGYKVYKGNSKTGSFTLAKTVTQPTYTEATLKRGRGQFLKIVAVKNNLESTKNVIVFAYSKLPYTVKDGNRKAMAGFIGSTYYQKNGTAASGTITRTGKFTGKYNVRKSAPSGKVLVVMKKGNKATILSEKIVNNAYWYKVKVTKSSKTYKGWVHGDGITTA